ncbi:hydrogenase accessory protein HypB [candidate division WOR-1 bacterium RIFOXYA12_FULL_52_29]|uniref:Hydrogenase accessory protein HypB n=1 Tax=candidate division WOR-1 bacterium RIFOXYC12_FULL_54_18 TaxID=1802584 RepID=A0A1F4T6E9_UNCSA|nr:MAG: hydrogenase accessory protein HypB [candidate division WOR-1 bacterium RIFOXYA2_FULL_51_19]OGC17672.1 MAG: hydrogenase accessory protein HypB [candidate division WOR-1 bacterium RIFOXYA12_FULL_52_29]OGC26529.1 MAG: hydrogenase accessory protein HypB [candidate division WOR-1 bacterium RIFOXYB2_FULL_45_9]OGC28089.1 MAG: hydrogenase accessory protein HypB [candidate division WOR-1 bacterium RIFOXYC12_FULL_54_18]OGC29625.1 MAG: hydrogenase accessory protein HypB [candidate division WOR-1 b
MKIQIKKSIFATNDQTAAAVRKKLAGLELAAVNLLASPGAGKTSLLLRLLNALSPKLKVGVIEGDVASSIDTEKIKAAGFPAVQINTDGGCHLTAAMIGQALDRLALTGPGIVFIENIGNLICPVEYDLGESLRLVVASVPEGDDKPVKYPAVFQSADAIVINKNDLLGQVDFDLETFTSRVRVLNERAPLFPLSCKTNSGVDPLISWLARKLTS